MSLTIEVNGLDAVKTFIENVVNALNDVEENKIDNDDFYLLVKSSTSALKTAVAKVPYTAEALGEQLCNWCDQTEACNVAACGVAYTKYTTYFDTKVECDCGNKLSYIQKMCNECGKVVNEIQA